MTDSYEWEESVHRSGRWYDPWSWSIKRVEYDGRHWDVRHQSGEARTKRAARRRVTRARAELEAS